MFDHITLKRQDHFRKLDSIFTAVCMIIILSLFFSVLILMFL